MNQINRTDRPLIYIYIHTLSHLLFIYTYIHAANIHLHVYIIHTAAPARLTAAEMVTELVPYAKIIGRPGEAS